MQVKRMVLVK